MKRKFFSVLLVLLLALSLCGTAMASETAESAEPVATAESSLPLDYVTDDAFILTDEELYDLNERAAEFSDMYQYGIYIITVNNYAHLELEAGEVEDLTDCAAAIYEEYDLGYGEGKNGILLMISVESQEYAILDHGDITFSDQNKSLLADTFIPAFAAESWYDGFRAYLEGISQIVPAAKEGTDLESVELNPDGGLFQNPLFYVGIAAIILILVLVVFLLLRSKKKKAEAAKQQEKKDKKKK